MIKNIEYRLKIIKYPIIIRYIYEIGKAASINRHDSRESCFKLHNCESLMALNAVGPRSCHRGFDALCLLAFKSRKSLTASLALCPKSCPGGFYALCFWLHNRKSLMASLALCPKSCLKDFELRSSMLLAFKMASRLLASGFFNGFEALCFGLHNRKSLTALNAVGPRSCLRGFDALCFGLHNRKSLTASLALCPKSCLKDFELRSSMLLAFKMASMLLALSFIKKECGK